MNWYPVLQRDQDLAGQAFLYLGTLAEKTHHPIDLGQADDFIPGDVGHLGDTIDGDEVMFTGTGQVDVTYLDHFIGAHLVFNQG